MAKPKKELTLRQIAEISGISKSTVSRVLTNHPSVSEHTRRRVKAVMAEHGFQPNIFARGLAGGPTGLIAVIAAEITSGFFAEVMSGINEIANRNSAHLLSCIAHGHEDYIQLWQTFAKRGRVDGVVLLAPPTQLLDQPFSLNQVPVILCACRADRQREGWRTADTVSVNNARAIHELLDHLMAQGARHILYIGGPGDVFDAQERRRSIMQCAHNRADMKLEVLEGGMTREYGHAAMHEYLDRHGHVPDAVMAFNDSSAYGILEALRQRDISVPAQCLVTGCDDEPASAILGLTSLHMPMRELGSEAARMLFEQLQSESDTHHACHSIMDLSLEIRASSLRGR
jgi:LacI family transcriptional regulator